MNKSTINNLAAMFQNCSIKEFGLESVFFRGCWQENDMPIGCWYADNIGNAAQYVAMHAEIGRHERKVPFIFSLAPKVPLRLFEFSRNHVDAFAKAYGGNWDHRSLEQDIPAALSQSNGPIVHGFFRPKDDGWSEYFIVPLHAAVTYAVYARDEAALKIVSSIKGYSV